MVCTREVQACLDPVPKITVRLVALSFVIQSPTIYFTLAIFASAYASMELISGGDFYMLIQMVGQFVHPVSVSALTH